MTNERLAEIEARANAATGGPWEAGHPYIVQSKYGGGGRRIVFTNATLDDSAKTDASFVAAARADIPDLIAEVRHQREMKEHHNSEATSLERLHHNAVVERDMLRAALRQIVDGCVEERPGFRVVSYTLIDEAKNALGDE